MPNTSTSVPYNETEKEDLSDYPIYPFCSDMVFEQQKHSHLSHKASVAMQKANRMAADDAVKTLNLMTKGSDILKAYPFIDAGNANKIATQKPTTWYFLDLILMQRQISDLLGFHKKKLGITPPPATP
jgi:hypothetical protein